MKSRLALLWSSIRDSLWFIPALCTVVGSVAAIGIVAAERSGRISLPDLMITLGGGGAESALALLSAVAGGLITVTGVAFSVTIVALELSSSQYTPRILPNFFSDRATQVVLGVLIGTFTYSLLVLRTIEHGEDGGADFVPQVAVAVGAALALLSVGALIFFINHAATAIQVSWILHRATTRALDQVDRLFPDDFGSPDRSAVAGEEDVPEDHVRIVAPESGYLQAIDASAVFEFGRSREAVIRMMHPIGAFVLEGEALALVWPPTAVDDRSVRKLARAFALGSERTREQDYELTLVELSDIAVRALSPGINDPTTAQHCIDRLSQLLLALARRHAPTKIRTDDGRLHVIVRDLPFDRAVDSAFSQILHFGASNPAIRDRLLERLDTLIELVPPERRRPLVMLRASVRDRSTDEKAPLPVRDR